MPIVRTLYRAYVWRWYASDVFPRRIGMEVTDRCNLRCRACPASRLTTKAGDINLKLVRRVAEEAAQYPGREFTVHKMGEPLLNDDLWAIVQELKRTPRGTVLLTTNGTLLDKHCDQLAGCGVDVVKVSVSAAMRETYERLKGDDRLEVVEEGILKLLRARGTWRTKPRVVVQAIREELSEEEIRVFRKKWSKHPVVVSIAPRENWNGEIPARPSGAARQFAGRRYPCFYLWTHPQVNVDGTVSACPTDWNRKLMIGDLRDNSLAEIWTGQRLNDLRARHLAGEYGECEMCDSWRIYPSAFRAMPGGGYCR